MSYRSIILNLLVILLASCMMSAYACSCVRNPKWTIRDELNLVDIVVKGKIISVADYSDSNFPWKYKLFRLVVEKKYKIPLNTTDTIAVITGQDGGSCGYAFKLGKEYILYGRIRPQKKATIGLQPDKSMKKPIESDSATLFETDICTLTKEANRRELMMLRRLTTSD